MVLLISDLVESKPHFTFTSSSSLSASSRWNTSLILPAFVWQNYYQCHLGTSWTKSIKSLLLKFCLDFKRFYLSPFLITFEIDWLIFKLVVVACVIYWSYKQLKQQTLIATFFFSVWKSHSSLGEFEDNNKILGVGELADISKFLLSLFTDLLLHIVKLRWDIQDSIQHK